MCVEDVEACSDRCSFPLEDMKREPILTVTVLVMAGRDEIGELNFPFCSARPNGHKKFYVHIGVP